MPYEPIRLDSIEFHGPNKAAKVVFAEGVNVICGASDTGKSFLAETIDFMLGGATLKEIPERVPYASAALTFTKGVSHQFKVGRSLSGGNFGLRPITDGGEGEEATLKQQHAHGKDDNLSGFLLGLIGLSGKRILKSKANSTTQSLSFRNLARLIIVQEGEIQSADSPFLSGQHTSRTPDLATVKLLLTGVDDSAVVAAGLATPSNAQQIALLDELISDLTTDIEDAGIDQGELEDQLQRLERTIEDQRTTMRAVQQNLDVRISERRAAYGEWSNLTNREAEIGELLARFLLLERHYQIDLQRLNAIVESGSLFVHLEPTPCPLCGALPASQHSHDECDGDAEGIVLAARAEGAKVQRLLEELRGTVVDLGVERGEVASAAADSRSKYDSVDLEIREIMAPQADDARAQFSELVEVRSQVTMSLSLVERRGKLQQRRETLFADDSDLGEVQTLETGLPDASAHALSMIVERILKAWNFPGECRVHFDKGKSDFVIDGKPRGSRGKGLRAITHAAITLALLEFCRERALPHPGFVVLDSPLLAYFKPEGEDDVALQGTDLKERFYEYLIQQHGRDSQVIVIENDHPPEKYIGSVPTLIFTGNPSKGRFGLL